MKNIFLGIIIAVILTTLMLISGEIAIRTYHYFKYGGKSVGTITLDNDLGWRTTENVKFVQKKWMREAIDI